MYCQTDDAHFAKKKPSYCVTNTSAHGRPSAVHCLCVQGLLFAPRVWSDAVTHYWSLFRFSSLTRGVRATLAGMSAKDSNPAAQKGSMLDGGEWLPNRQSRYNFFLRRLTCPEAKPRTPYQCFFDSAQSQLKVNTGVSPRGSPPCWNESLAVSKSQRRYVGV